MNDQSKSPSAPKPHRLRNKALMGTAAALIIGGAITGEAVIFPKTPAYADPVNVQAVQIPSFANLVAKVRPAVVSVRVKEKVAGVSDQLQNMAPDFNFPPGSPMERFFRQFQQNQGQNKPNGHAPYSMALGSGFFISDDGYLVTNNHVVDKGASFTVVTDDGTEYPAKVVGTDDKTDLALLKVDPPTGVKFTYVKFADSPPRIGDWVVAVGNPFGLGGTVTAGIVSAEGRQIGGNYDNYIQIDAPVNRGNSGGPTFNVNGEVIGINTAIYSPSGGSVGIAFDIPASTASQIIQDLKNNGSVVRGWLGVEIQGVTKDIADSLNLSSDNGALVAQPQDGSPAANAGIKAGDVILAVNGDSVKNPRDLALKISNMAPGSKVTVTYWRDGAKHDVNIALGKLPDSKQQASVNQPQNVLPSSALKGFGLSLGPSDNHQGVVITNVDPSGEGAQRGLQPGDVIVSVGSTTVNSPSEVEKKVAAAKSDGLKAVLLRVKSGDQTRFVALPFART